MIGFLNTINPRVCYLLFGANELLVVALFAAFFAFLYFLFERKSIDKKWLLLVSALPIALYFLRYLLNDYFLSDDFDHFIVVNKFSYKELFVNGLLAKGVWAFHRLFVAFWLFKLTYFLFGANYEVFMIFNFLLHMVNFYLFYTVLKRIARNKYSIYFTLFIFAFYYLSWISNIHELIAATFFLLTFRLLIAKIIDKKKSLAITAAALATYFLGVSSKEVVFLLPLVFSLFLVSYNYYKEKIDLKKSFRKLVPLYLFGIFYLIIFASDYLGFTGFETGSGYQTSFVLGRMFDNFSFYLNHRLVLFSPLFTLTAFSFITFLIDWYRKKAILTPLYLSYFIFLLPVSLFEKFEPYYSYIPSFFLFLVVLIYSEFIAEYISRKIKDARKNILMILLASFFAVYLFGINKNLQDACYFLQFPRPHARRVAVESAVSRVRVALSEGKTRVDFSPEQSEKLNWFLSHDYIRYFLNSMDTSDYRFVYDKKTGILDIKEEL